MQFFENKKYIFIVALLIRIIIVGLYGDTRWEHEYNTLIYNLLNGNGFSYWSVLEDGSLSTQINENVKYFIPSAYMPPLYPGFCAVIAYIFGFNNIISINIILFIQALLGSINILMLKKIARIKFNQNIAIIFAWVLVFFPLHAYMSSQISPSTIYVFLFSSILYFYNIIKLRIASIKELLLLGISMGLLILIRADAILIIPAIFVLFHYVNKKISFRNNLLITIMAIVTISPFSLRNKLVFDFYYPLTISAGFSLWVGNNEEALGSQYVYHDPPGEIPIRIINKINSIQKNKYYEINRDKIFMEEAKDYIINNPLRVIKLSLKKVVFFWIHIYDKRIKYPNNNNFFYWFPWLFFTLPFIKSLFSLRKNFRDHDLEYFILLYFTVVYSIFMVVPRYRIIILPIYIMFSVYEIEKYLNKFLTNKLKGQ